MTARPLDEQTRVWLAILLAAIAGYVDVIGYLTLYHLFTAHMTGNTAALGAAVSGSDWRDALVRVFPIPLFFLGVIAGVLLLEIAARSGLRSGMAVALAAEAALIALFMFAGTALIHAGDLHGESDGAFFLLAACATLAMGVQTATFQRAGGHGVRTTYVTGMLTDLAHDAVHYVLYLVDAARLHPDPRERRRWKHEARVRMAVLAGIWAMYVTGAIGGGIGDRSWGLWALALPLIALAGLIAVDIARPLQPPRQEEPTKID